MQQTEKETSENLRLVYRLVVDSQVPNTGPTDQSKNALERLSSDELTGLCEELVAAAEGNVLAHEYGYACALGIICATPTSPAQFAALETIADMLNDPERVTLLFEIRKGFEAKAKSLRTSGFDLRPDFRRPFDKATYGFLLASNYAPLQDADFVETHIGPISNFLEDVEKTRTRMPDWIELQKFKGWFSDIADGHRTLAGRKHPDMARILRLFNDGADLVSINDCVEATRRVFEGLVHTDQRCDPESFIKNLDVLDDHKSFYEVAFQPQFLELGRESAFMDVGFQYHDDQGRANFGRNLAELAKRTEARLPDSRIMLAGFLLGGSLIDTMIAKDRTQGDPFWLENEVLNKARHSRTLAVRDSSLRVVIEALLEGRTPDERKAFWENRPERALIQQRDREEESPSL